MACFTKETCSKAAISYIRARRRFGAWNNRQTTFTVRTLNPTGEARLCHFVHIKTIYLHSKPSEYFPLWLCTAVVTLVHLMYYYNLLSSLTVRAPDSRISLRNYCLVDVQKHLIIYIGP